MAAPTNKRRSLQVNVGNGPKPLHLLDSNIPTPPATAPLSFPSSPSLKQPNPRRQSSISYITRSGDSTNSRSSPLSRSNSANGARSTIYPKKVLDRNSTGSLSGPKERPPMTLAEKHADLLQFIAQKEAKCLELRSQLATHEAELVQLKRKWERVVARGFPSTAPYPSATIPTSSAPSSTVVLEGIREGVQGVSRFLAEFSSPPPPSPKSSPKSHTPSSSLSTYTSSVGTRHSLSSASSLQSDYERLTEEPEQTLMVRDTGATPTMSPNPDFHFQQELSCSTSPTAVDRTAKIHRRKSRELPVVPAADDDDLSKMLKRDLSNLSGSSWVGQVGRKWEEIQKGATFTKSQKRASLLISDMSNTLYSAASALAISSPPTPSLSPAMPSSSTAFDRSTLKPVPTPPPVDDDPWSSLLNDDPSTLGIGVMKPDPSPSLSPNLQTPQAVKQNSDEDEDWNW